MYHSGGGTALALQTEGRVGFRSNSGRIKPVTLKWVVIAPSPSAMHCRREIHGSFGYDRKKNPQALVRNRAPVASYVTQGDLLQQVRSPEDIATRSPISEAQQTFFLILHGDREKLFLIARNGIEKKNVYPQETKRKKQDVTKSYIKYGSRHNA
jgi:hypothetical protein